MAPGFSSGSDFQIIPEVGNYHRNSGPVPGKRVPDRAYSRSSTSPKTLARFGPLSQFHGPKKWHLPPPPPPEVDGSSSKSRFLSFSGCDYELFSPEVGLWSERASNFHLRGLSFSVWDLLLQSPLWGCVYFIFSFFWSFILILEILGVFGFFKVFLKSYRIDY